MGRAAHLVLLGFVLATAANAARFSSTVATLKSNLETATSNAAAAEPDLVASVPGFEGDLKSRHHAGYIPVGQGGKRLFYYFIESEGNPASDPVVLWLNGGPGCSSFDGFVYEHGPFNFQLVQKGPNGPLGVRLTENPYGWNKVASMIFLDSPAGVGLSYSEEGGSEYVTDDMTTASDAEDFLRKFFDLHPDFQANPFFISGESYAGVYVPNLARAVVEGNMHGRQPHINIEGYLVGNAVTDQVIDNNALPLFASGKSLIAHALFREMEGACGPGISMPGSGAWNATNESKCDRLMDEVIADVSRLNVYDILEDCYLGPTPDRPINDDTEDDTYIDGTGEEEEDEHYAPTQLSHAERVQQMLASMTPRNTMQQALAVHGRKWPVLGSTPKAGQQVHNWAMLGLSPPCTDSRAGFIWLNDPAVRRALHAEPVSKIGLWNICSDKISYTRVIPSLIPIHKSLTQKHGLRALVYSGDHDMAVPHTGSEAWTSGSQLGARLVKSWRPWMVDRQVAGYVVEYEGLTYATVKGAGHMVPENKPKESLIMFQKFLANKPLA